MLRVGRPQDGVRDPKVHPALSDLRLTDHLGRRLEPRQQMVDHLESGRRNGGRLLALQHVAHLCLEDFDVDGTVTPRRHPAQDFGAVAVPNVHTQHKTHCVRLCRNIIKLCSHLHLQSQLHVEHFAVELHVLLDVLDAEVARLQRSPCVVDSLQQAVRDVAHPNEEF